MLVLDYIKAELDAESYLHFASGVKLSKDSNGLNIINEQKQINLTTIGISGLDIKESWYSEQFNQKVENKSLILTKDKCHRCFGYCIELESSSCEIIDSGTELCIIGDKEIVINYKELGDRL